MVCRTSLSAALCFTYCIHLCTVLTIFSLSTGGMDNFEGKFPHHCITRKALSPTAVTLDTSTLERKERPGIPEGKPVEVLPHLYLGSAKDSSNIDNLRAMGITAILNITTNCPNLFESEFEYMSIHEEDSPHTDLLSRINQAIQFIGKYWNRSLCCVLHE